MSVANPQDLIEQQKAERLQSIFQDLKSNNMQLDEDSTLVLLDVDDTLAYLSNNGGGYNDFLIEKLRDLAKDPKVKFCLFTKMSLEEIKDQNAGEKRRTEVLLRLKEYGIGIERVIMPGDLGHRHPTALEFLQQAILDLKNEIPKLMEQMAPPATSEEQAIEIKQQLERFGRLTTLSDEVEFLKDLLENLVSMYPNIESQVGKRIARDIQNSTTQLLIRVETLQRKVNDSHKGFPHIAGSSFVDHYIPAFQNSHNGIEYEQYKNENNCLAKLDREISQKYLALNEEENSSEARHSKASFLDALLADPHTGFPGKIIQFDDRSECTSSVKKRVEQINGMRLEQGKYAINFVGVHLQNDGKDTDVNRAAITKAVGEHLIEKRIPFRANNLSAQEREKRLSIIRKEMDAFIPDKKQLISDLIELAQIEDVTALYFLAKMAVKGDFGLPKDRVSAYYLARLAHALVITLEGRKVISQFITENFDNKDFNLVLLYANEPHQDFPPINRYNPKQLFDNYKFLRELEWKELKRLNQERLKHCNSNEQSQDAHFSEKIKESLRHQEPFLVFEKAKEALRKQDPFLAYCYAMAAYLCCNDADLFEQIEIFISGGRFDQEDYDYSKELINVARFHLRNPEESLLLQNGTHDKALEGLKQAFSAFDAERKAFKQQPSMQQSLLRANGIDGEGKEAEKEEAKSALSIEPSDNELRKILMVNAAGGNISAYLQLAEFAMTGEMNFPKDLKAAQVYIEGAVQLWTALPEGEKKNSYGTIIEMQLRKLQPARIQEAKVEADKKNHSTIIEALDMPDDLAASTSSGSSFNGGMNDEQRAARREEKSEAEADKNGKEKDEPPELISGSSVLGTDKHDTTHKVFLFDKDDTVIIPNESDGGIPINPEIHAEFFAYCISHPAEVTFGMVSRSGGEMGDRNEGSLSDADRQLGAKAHRIDDKALDRFRKEVLRDGFDRSDAAARKKSVAHFCAQNYRASPENILLEAVKIPDDYPQDPQIFSTLIQQGAIAASGDELIISLSLGRHGNYTCTINPYNNVILKCKNGIEIEINLKKYILSRDLYAKGDNKIFQALDGIASVGIAVIPNEAMHAIGIVDICAPAHFKFVSPEQVCGFDDQPLVVAGWQRAGFRAVLADSPETCIRKIAEGRLEQMPVSTNTYIRALIEHLGPEALPSLAQCVNFHRDKAERIRYELIIELRKKCNEIADGELKGHLQRVIWDLELIAKQPEACHGLAMHLGAHLGQHLECAEDEAWFLKEILIRARQYDTSLLNHSQNKENTLRTQNWKNMAQTHLDFAVDAIYLRVFNAVKDETLQERNGIVATVEHYPTREVLDNKTITEPASCILAALYNIIRGQKCSQGAASGDKDALIANALALRDAALNGSRQEDPNVRGSGFASFFSSVINPGNPARKEIYDAVYREADKLVHALRVLYPEEVKKAEAVQLRSSKGPQR